VVRRGNRQQGLASRLKSSRVRVLSPISTEVKYLRENLNFRLNNIDLRRMREAAPHGSLV